MKTKVKEIHEEKKQKKEEIRKCKTLKNNHNGITLIALVITIIVLLILASVSIAMLTGDNGILTRAGDAKIETALGAVKEQVRLYQIEKKMNEQEVTAESLLAEGKVSRTVQAGEDNQYYMYYALKDNSFEGMQGLGKGNIASQKDVFLIDDNLNVKYISSNGKEYGDNLNNKILEDETEIRFSSKAFSEYVSKISGVTEDEMKFKWMKNQTQLEISDLNIESLQDLVFFPNLRKLSLSNINLENMSGIENCTLINTLGITLCKIKDFTKIGSLQNLSTFYNFGPVNIDKLIDGLSKCSNLKDITIRSAQLNNMKRIEDLKSATSISLLQNQITKVEGIENLPNLKSLDINQNPIKTIDDMIKKQDLEYLYINNCGIENIEGIEKLTNLKKLDISSNKIIDITPLANNEKLTYLNIKNNANLKIDNFTQEEQEKINKIGQILDRGGKIDVDTKQLRLFNNYTTLDLSNQGLTTLECLEGMTNLRSLNLLGNKLTLEDEKSREILASMTKLQGLDIRYNKITNMTAVNELKNIQYIYAAGGNNFKLKDMENLISKISLHIDNSVLQTIVDCDVNKVTKISIYNVYNTFTFPDMAKFINLKELIINGNKITNFEVIEKIPNLEVISISIQNFNTNIPIDFSKFSKLRLLTIDSSYITSDSLRNLKIPKTLTSLNLRNNTIIDATPLLELDSGTKINLTGNINLSQDSKDKLKAKFGNNVTF